MDFNDLLQFLKTNQFASGGLTVVFTGALLALCRQVPARLWNWTRNRIFYTVEIQQGDAAFLLFIKTLDNQNCKYRYRSLQVKAMWNCLGEFDFRFSPGPGRHFFWCGRLPMWLHRSRRDMDSTIYCEGATFDTLKFQTFLFGRQRLLDFLEQVRLTGSQPDPGRTLAFMHSGSDWHERGIHNGRTADNVILDAGIMDDLVQDAETFVRSRDKYRERGVPYRRGYLFHGPPGCGKTSTILALAEKLKAFIYIINIGSRDLSDQHLALLISRCRTGSIVVLEDVDAAFTSREETVVVQTPKGETPQNKAPAGVTFSGLLNALDGIASGEGRLLFMTTNHLDTLDPALRRPGRADKMVLFGNASKYQARLMFLKFFPGVEVGAARFEEAYVDHSMSMAALQEMLLDARDLPERAIKSMESQKAPQICPHVSLRNNHPHQVGAPSH